MDESPWTTPASNRGRDLVASSATALATAQVIGAGGVIQGCYRTSEDDRKGELRVVSDPASCRTNELPISWNAQGPKGDKGDQGIQGIQGLQGPEGPVGPPGISGYEVVYESRILDFTNDAGSRRTVGPTSRPAG
jgi:hypothetical protein